MNSKPRRYLDAFLLDHCFVAARWLEEAINTLNTWKIHVHHASRLPMAQHLLKRVATRSAFPSTESELIRVGNALSAAWDFRNIVRVLPPNPIAPIVEDLKRAIKGTLDDVEPTEAHRAQSQVAFGAILVAAGLLPGAPDTTRGPSPDYMISIDTLPCGVEIKRPGSVAAMTDAVDDAISQMTDFGARYQVVHLDFSDAVRSKLIAGLRQGIRLSPLHVFRQGCDQVSSYLHSLADLRVMVTYLSMRFFEWELQPEPHFSYVGRFQIEIFQQACSGLVVKQSERIRDAIMRGSEKLGMMPNQVRPV